jgi:hypothetical protein
MQTQTREEQIVELTKALAALGYSIEKLKIDYCGKLDDPDYTQVRLRIVRFKMR